LYKLLATVYGAETVETYLRRDDLAFDIPAIVAEIERTQPAVVILNSPNNPTGTNLSLDGWRAICDAAPGLIVADQAYVEFGGDSAIPLLTEYERLIVLRTFSKAGSLAGLRVGYAACDPGIAEQIAKAKLPYNVNFFTIAAASVVLKHQDRFEAIIELLQNERDRVYRRLQTMSGVRVYPSAANYLLFETPLPPDAVFRRVYDHGVLIRNVSKYPMLERALRVSIGKPEENDRFLAALEESLGASADSTEVTA